MYVLYSEDVVVWDGFILPMHKIQQFWKRLIQEFCMTLIYINVETNAIADTFIRLPMAHNAHKLEDINLEEYTCELLCLD